jgi:hypothetical protein
VPVSGIIRWGAVAFMLGGVVWITFNAYALSQGGTPARPGPGFVAFYVAALLLSNAGLLGFHALQQDSYGRLGRAALYTVLGSSALLIVNALILLFTIPAVFNVINMIGLVGVLIGFILYGVATLRASTADLVWRVVHRLPASFDSPGELRELLYWAGTAGAGVRTLATRGIDPAVLASELGESAAAQLTNLLELRSGGLPRTLLPRTRVNKGC